ncbi:MAG: hypothetical protein HYR57_02255 [Candidatus Koribacter versatilis]|nr:hypothetical protein [Candidatus Koribacter versatilis]
MEKPAAVDAVVPQSKPNQPAGILIFARSNTVYMNSDTIHSWLQREPEFNQLGLVLTANQGQADYYVEINRPLFTWDWTFGVVKEKSGKPVASGKVTAATAERAAKALAPRIIQALYSESSASGRMAAGAEFLRGTTTGGILPRTSVASEGLARRFESAKTFSIHSATVWFEPSDLEKALKERPEFSGWGYELVNPEPNVPSGQAVEVNTLPDLTLEVNRPLFTWDWTFSIQDRKTNQNLASGRLTAISGPAAAPRLAKAIVGAIASARGRPAPMQQQLDRALKETEVRTWNVRHISGQSHLKGGKKVRFAVGRNTAFACDGEEILFSVPIEDILLFSCSSNRHDPSTKWFEGWDKAGEIMFSPFDDDGGAAVGALAVMLPMVAVDYGVGGLLKASTTTEYFLTLNWKDTAGVTTATFQGDKKDIPEICAELVRSSKRPAVDLDAATQRVRTEFDERLQSTNYYIETDQSVTLDNSVLAPGKYRVVILQREKNLAEVYFLYRPANAIAARTMVVHGLRPEGDRATRVSYGIVSGLQTFQEIQIDEHILRFNPVPISPDEI